MSFPPPNNNNHQYQQSPVGSSYQPIGQYQPGSPYTQQPTSQYTQPTSQYSQPAMQSQPTSQYSQPGMQSQPGSQYSPYNQQSTSQYQPGSQYSQPPPTSSPYSAYPETNPQSNVKQNHSYQNERQAGWNEPPLKLKIDAEMVLKGVSNVEQQIVMLITDKISFLNTRVEPSKRRLLQDCEKRLEELFEKLATGIQRQVLATLWVICGDIKGNRLEECRGKVTEFMTVAVNDTRWVLGIKRLVELLLQYQS